MSIRSRTITACLAVAQMVFLSACPSSEGTDRELVVFAAASLTDVFTELSTIMEQREPGLAIQLNFAGSQQLATQIEHGAPADVYATANRAWLTYLSDRTLVRDAYTFASNSLAILARSPLSLGAIADPGTQIVIGAETVPIGRYTQELFARLEEAEGYGPGFVAAVRANVVSEEDNVRSVLAKVLVGEADVAIVYGTDVISVENEDLFSIPIPAEFNLATEYLVAPVRAAVHPDEAGRFVEFLLSAEGRDVLRRYGFGLPEGQ